MADYYNLEQLARKLGIAEGGLAQAKSRGLLQAKAKSGNAQAHERSRSELLIQAYGKISNPFVLCTVISRRMRQFMMSANGNRSTAEIFDYVLGESVAGLLQFEMHEAKESKSNAPQMRRVHTDQIGTPVELANKVSSPQVGAWLAS